MTPEEIKQQIKENDLYALGALLTLYEYQTLDEQGSLQTKHANEVGFNALDASILSDIAQFYQRRGSISPRQIALIRPKLYKYCAQLSRIGGVRPAENNNHPASVRTKKEKQVEIYGEELKLIFPYDPAVIDIVRDLPGRQFVKTEKEKFWTIPKTVMGITKIKELGFKIPEEILKWIGSQKSVSEMDPDKIELNGFKTELRPFQKQGVAFIDSKSGNALIADDMGCIEGDALITINRGGGSRKYKLRDAYQRFNRLANQRLSWDQSISTFTSALKKDRIGLHEIKSILYKGERETIKLTTESGKAIRTTPDHKIATPTPNKWTRIDELKIGDTILCNGQSCKRCHSQKNLITYKHSKFKGYCKKCMYSQLRHHKNDIWENRNENTTDGYVYLTGIKYRNHPRYSKTGGLLEHIYIMEQILGRPLKPNEEAHHKNEIRNDNRPKNLLLVTKSEHRKLHKSGLRFNGGHTKSGNEIILIPKPEKIIKIEKGGITDVYDIVMKNPYRNFIANRIIVHNCGKTIEALAWLHIHPEIRPVLIVVPASVKYNWRKEALRFMNPAPKMILPSGQTPDETLPQQSFDFVIINYDILMYWKEVLSKIKFQAMILDEAHRTKNHKAERSKATFFLKKRIDKLVALTGTPILSRPIEIFNCLRMLRPDMFRSRWEFARRYCNLHHNGFAWDMNGATNKEELHEILVREIMIRRRKSDVLKELPEKQHSPIPIEIENRAVYRRAEADFMSYLRSVDPKKASSAARAQVLAEIEGLKQLALKGKLKNVGAWIDDFLEDTEEKLVIFATHHVAIDSLMEWYGSMSVKIDGRVPQNKRQEIIDQFQKDPSIRLFVGNIQAAGEGITLTAASNCVFIELPWTPGALEQASDRIHRIGQEANSVNIYYLIAEGTIEEQIMKVLDSKRQTLREIMDGIAPEDDEESTLSMLLEEYRSQL